MNVCSNKESPLASRVADARHHRHLKILLSGSPPTQRRNCFIHRVPCRLDPEQYCGNAVTKPGPTFGDENVLGTVLISPAYNDVIRSIQIKQRLCTIVMMRREIANFWEDVRQALRPEYGQESGQRNREKARLREQLASELRLSSRTLKGFLNGNQASLGQEALFALFAKLPGFEARYREATGRQQFDAANGTPPQDRGVYIQMTLQFDGSDNPPRSLTARLPQGRQGVLTIKIGPSRVA